MSDIVLYEYTPDLVATLEKQGKEVIIKQRVYCRYTDGDGIDEDRRHALRGIIKQAKNIGATAIIVVRDEEFDISDSGWIIAGNAVVVVDTPQEEG